MSLWGNYANASVKLLQRNEKKLKECAFRCQFKFLQTRTIRMGTDITSKVAYSYCTVIWFATNKSDNIFWAILSRKHNNRMFFTWKVWFEIFQRFQIVLINILFLIEYQHKFNCEGYEVWTVTNGTNIYGNFFYHFLLTSLRLIAYRMEWAIHSLCVNFV